MSEMITLTIDGVTCTCEKGEYLYDVAKRNGIFIPTLCRHDGFEDHRACCRICIVEVEQRGRTKIVTSCVYPVEGECEVRTNTERIQEERAVLYALLGHRAPEADLIGEMSSGLDMGGFERLVSIDNEKCILCGLCVQACDSLGTGAISTVERGTDKHDAHTNWRDESIEIFIDTGNGFCRQIAVTPAGGVWDASDDDLLWDSGAKATPAFSDDRWTLDISIPYESLGGEPKLGDRWDFMVIRNGGKHASCGWPIDAHRDFSAAATLVFK